MAPARATPAATSSTKVLQEARRAHATVGGGNVVGTNSDTQPIDLTDRYYGSVGF